MTPEELFGLPPGIALKLIFQSLDDSTRERVLSGEKPKLPFAPKFDRVIFRKEGVMYASECDLECLRFWHKRALEGAASGGQYAEKDAKSRDELARWMAWRECYPDATWTGERDREQTTAKAPSAKPMVYPRNGQRRAPPPPPDDGIDPNGEIPF